MSEIVASMVRTKVDASGGGVVFEIYAGKGVGDDTLIFQYHLTSTQASAIGAGFTDSANTDTKTRLSQTSSYANYSNVI